MNVERIQPSPTYVQDEVRRIQENLARVIETVTQSTMLVPAGTVANITLPTNTANPMPLQLSPAIQWYMTVPFSGSVISFSASTFIGSGGPVAYFIAINGKVVYNIIGAFAQGNQSVILPSPLLFQVNDNVQVYARSATSNPTQNAYIFAHLEIAKGVVNGTR